MAACSELEEKTSSIEDTGRLKIFLEETADYSRSELSNKLNERAKTGDLTTLSDDEFLHLLKEASTFNKPNNQESVLLKQLRKEVAETEPHENVNERSEHKHSKILLCNTPSSSSSSQRTLDGKRGKNKIRDDSKNALNSDKNVLQSLSLQDLLSPETKSKKSHKAHRTLSLSSEEAATIISDSLTVTSKTSKKTNKQSSSKNSSELNRSSFTKCSSKGSGGESLSGDSGQKRKYDALVQNSSLPYETLINECDIPLPDDPRPEEKAKSTSSSSPIEIEMEELKGGKEGKSVSSRKELLEKDNEDVQQSSSKFYVDSNEVDTTVAFPLQLVSSMENGPVNFPLVPWPRPLQVQTLLDDKQLLNADINGNPFSRTSRPSLASFVSTTFLDYNNSNLVSENKNRKNKRFRNAVNKGVLSENIAGHRGEEDIDTLLQYINSSDKKGKSVKGNQMLTSKSMLHDNERKKSLGREIKNGHKNMINVKKKLSRSNSLENLVSNSRHQENINSLSYESNAILDKPLKNAKSASFEKAIQKTLDINSNVETHFCDTRGKSKDSSLTDESICQSSSIGESSPEVSSFAADFYSTADVSSQTVEESGFLIVKKKQRKKHQGKRSESYRWRTAQTQRKKGMMIPLAESKCGKQDSRRKSTSSVPHSEHSSADNSDLDSVHSLPVRGSVPHPTQPHPHTTPSSSSSTPQASYADIARMPIQKLNSPSPCIMTYSTQVSAAKPQVADHDTRKVESYVNSFSCVKRRVPDVRENIPVPSKSCSLPEVSDEDSLSPDVKIRSHAKSTREINTQTEPETCSSETETVKAKKADESCKTLCSVCFCPLKKNCSCSKSQTFVSRQKIKSSDIPPVIMDNMPAESNACNVSFGFGVEEVLQMTPATQPELQIKAETVLCSYGADCSQTVVVNKSPSANDSLGVSSVKVSSLPSSDLSCETSSHLRTVCYGTGRNICYSETKVNSKKFNLSEITNFLGMEFQCIESELGVSKSNGIGSKIMYYVDSAEEA